ncbi:MAG: hypothetical protein JWL64_1822 [Frankiales bacterium]|nr:hypothetical protein [Frankiales bacterium]
MLTTLRIRWRWAAVAACVTVLASLPALAQLRPVDDSELTAAQLRDLVRSSDQVAWEGIGESRVDLPLPDVEDLESVPALLGGRTRTRATWVAPDRWRVDQLDVAGEVDTLVDGDTTTTWVSGDRTLSLVQGELPVRLPRASDLLAPVLGRRLANIPDATLTRLGGRRVAGRSTAGLRLAPPDPTRTTVTSVDLWVDLGTGLVLRAEVRTGGQRNAVLTTLVLDLQVGSADADRLDLPPPPGADVTTARAPDVAAEIDSRVPFLLPGRLTGELKQDPAGLRSGGVGVYGTGFAAYAVVPLPEDVARRVLRAAPDDGLFATSLLNALVGRAGRTVYLLVGTVPEQTLRQGLAELQAAPPRRTA